MGGRWGYRAPERHPRDVGGVEDQLTQRRERRKIDMGKKSLAGTRLVLFRLIGEYSPYRRVYGREECGVQDRPGRRHANMCQTVRLGRADLARILCGRSAWRSAEIEDRAHAKAQRRKINMGKKPLAGTRLVLFRLISTGTEQKLVTLTTILRTWYGRDNGFDRSERAGPARLR